MEKQAVKEIALACGFKLKQQPDGTMDLNPYVYEFADQLLSRVRHGQEMMNMCKGAKLSEQIGRMGQRDLPMDMPPVHDPVNHPSHYKMGKVQCIEAIKSSLTEEEFRGYCKGNVIKYTWRERYKAGRESLEKAKWYLTYLLDKV